MAVPVSQTSAGKRAQRRKRMLAWLGYAVMAVLLCLTENTWYAFDSGTGIDLLPVLTAAAGLFEGIYGGAYFGIFCGVLSDAAGGAQIWVMPVCYALIGFLAGAASMRVYKKTFGFFLLFDLGACAVSVLVHAAAGLIAGGGMAAVLRPALLLGGIWSFVLGMLIYLPALILSVIGRETVRKVARTRARIVGARTRDAGGRKQN